MPNKSGPKNVTSYYWEGTLTTVDNAFYGTVAGDKVSVIYFSAGARRPREAASAAPARPRPPPPRSRARRSRAAESRTRVSRRGLSLCFRVLQRRYAHHLPRERRRRARVGE